ncbi:MAG: ATP-dependent zinc metalloprotease FtsH [Clostridia bacterium]|nr:ATP-dependent zinc metalloprotease FtsH [Clostridia bacterium]
MKKSNIKSIILYLAIFIAIILALSLMFRSSEPEKVLYSDVVGYFQDDMVADFVVDDSNHLTMNVYVPNDDGELEYDDDGKITNSKKTIEYQLQSLGLFVEDCGEYYKGNANLVEYEIEPETVMPWWVSFLPYVIVIAIVIILWVVMAKQMNGGGAGKLNSFGKAKVKTPQNDKNKVLFKDVAGADEEKEELQEVVEFLKDPTHFSKLGAKIPHGVLLVGPPGTGKTLLAKAVAGEAGVPFFSISGSDFVEMYVGVGASRVRDLFENARKHPASIIFIDEIDAVGRHRGAGLGGGHDEREQTLNQLLVEMDGFGSHEGIIVIAATNRPDILDPALLRPGRFDRQVTVNYPDIKGREEILKVHAKNKPLEETVDLAKVASTTAGFTGADLANLLNEAALLAARRGKNLIGMEDIEDAFIKVIAGPKKRSMRIKPDEKKKTAYHEAGHAILAHVLPKLDDVQQISIIPSGNALGYTLNPPKEDTHSVYKEGLKEKIAMLLGGRAAEELIFGDVSGGASNDIQRATDIAKKMVTQLGMSELLGPRSFGTGHSEVFLGRDYSMSQDYSDATAATIDSEIHKIIDEAYTRAKQILTENMQKLHFISEFLVKNEIMDGEQFKAAMEGEPTFEELEEMTEAKKRRSREENEEKQRRDEERRKRLEEEAERLAKEEEEALARGEKLPDIDIKLPDEKDVREDTPDDSSDAFDDSDNTETDKKDNNVNNNDDETL